MACGIYSCSGGKDHLAPFSSIMQAAFIMGCSTGSRGWAKKNPLWVPPGHVGRECLTVFSPSHPPCASQCSWAYTEEEISSAGTGLVQAPWSVGVPAMEHQVLNCDSPSHSSASGVLLDQCNYTQPWAQGLWKLQDLALFNIIFNNNSVRCKWHFILAYTCVLYSIQETKESSDLLLNGC